MIKPKTKQLASDETAPVTKFQFSPYQVNKLYHNDNDIIDFVTNGKSLYVCIVDGTVTSHANIDDESGFLKLVSQGVQGDTGARGDDGRPGNTPNLTFKFIDKQLLISENGVVKVASPDLTGPAWRPVLRGDNLDWELSKDRTVPQSIDLHDLTAPERPILLRTNSDNTKRDDEESGPANFIQWKYEGDAEWTNLISISELLNLALAGVSFWPDNDGYWHFGHKEVIRATYSSDDSGRDIISDVELGDVLFDAGQIPFANYSLDIDEIKDRLTILENKPDVDLNNYYTKNQSDTRFQPLGNYLTQHQPLKTINGESLVGTGNINIQGGSGDVPSLDGYATETWVNNQRFVKKVNNITPDANGNVTLSVAGNPLMSLKIEDNKLYKKAANDTIWIEVGPVGSGGSGTGGGLTEAQVKTLIGNALEGTNIPTEYARGNDHNYFIRLNDLSDYPTNSQVLQMIQDAILGLQGDLDYYRVFTLYQRTNSPSTVPARPVVGNWRWSSEINEIALVPGHSSSWTNHPENATTVTPYLWMTSATYSYKLKTEVGSSAVNAGVYADDYAWSNPICLTGTAGQDGRPGGDGADGKGIEFIYHLGANAPTVNKTKAYKSGETTKTDVASSWWETEESTDWLPGDGTTNGHWTDNPTGIDDTSADTKIEWACVRTSHYDANTGESVWDDFSNPFIWSMWGEDGIDGDGVEYIFYVTGEDGVTKDVSTGKATLNLVAYSGKIPLTDQEVTTLGASYQIDDWCPDGTTRGGFVMPDYNWTDNPSDVDLQQPYEFVCIRKYNGTTGKWGPFSSPKLWGFYGTTTIQTTVYGSTNYKPYTCYAFYRTNTDIASYRVLYDFTSLDGSYTINTGYNDLTATQQIQFYENPLQFTRTVNSSNVDQHIVWSDTIPSNSHEQLWLITAHIGDEDQASDTGWTSPVKWGDQVGFQTEYAVSSTATDAVYAGTSTLPNLSTLSSGVPKYETDDPVRDTDGDGIDESLWRSDVFNAGMGVWGDEDTVTDPDYMAVCVKKANGVWTDWQISRIKGEQGEKGDSIYSLETPQVLFTFPASENGVLTEPVTPVSSQFTLKYGKQEVTSGITWGLRRLDEFCLWDGYDLGTITKVTYIGQIDPQEAPRTDCIYKWKGPLGDFYYTNAIVINATTTIYDDSQYRLTYYGITSDVSGLQLSSSGLLYGTLTDFDTDSVLVEISATHSGVTTKKVVCFQKIRQGAIGRQGVSGVPYFFQGNWEVDTDYYHSNQRIDIVKNGDHYYICKIPHHSSYANEPTWNTYQDKMNDNDYWEAFQGEYKNLATGFLFAESAYIDGLRVRFADVDGVLCANRIIVSDNCNGQGEDSGANEALIDYIDRKATQMSDVVLNLSNDYQQVQIDGSNHVVYDPNIYTYPVLYKGTTAITIDDIEYYNSNGTWVGLLNNSQTGVYGGRLWYSPNIIGFDLNQNDTFDSSRHIIKLRAKRTESGETYYGYADWIIQGTTEPVYNIDCGTTQLILDDQENIINVVNGESSSQTYHTTEYVLRSAVQGNPILTSDQTALFFKWDDENNYYYIAPSDNRNVITFINSASVTGKNFVIHKTIVSGDTVSGWTDGNHKSYTVYAYRAITVGSTKSTQWSDYESYGVLLDYETTPIIRNGSTYILNVSMDYLPAYSTNSYDFKDFTITASISENGIVQSNTTFVVVGRDVSSSVNEIACTNLFTQSNGVLTIEDDDFDNWDDTFASPPKYIKINATCGSVTLSKQLYVIADGKNGYNGDDAVPYVYKGEWDSSITYTKNDQQIDVVKYGNAWYMCETQANTNHQPTGQTDTYWKIFSANFENVATNLILAERGHIQNLEVDAANITGQLTADKIAVVNSLETINDQGVGISIKDNEIKAFSENGEFVHITGDAISTTPSNSTYSTNTINFVTTIGPTSGTVVEEYYSLSSVFVVPTGSDHITVTVPQSGYGYILESRGFHTSECSFTVVLQEIGIGTGTTDHVMWTCPLMTRDGQWHYYTPSSSYTLSNPTAGYYRLAIKVHLKYYENSGPRDFGLNVPGLSSISVGSISPMLIEFGSNGVKFNLGNSSYAEFIHDETNGNKIVMQSDNGMYGIRLTSSGLTFKTNGLNYRTLAEIIQAGG